jgi:hypothetical protein
MMLRSIARARWSRLSLLAVALCRIGFGQSAALSLSPGSGNAGSTINLNLSLNASGAQPAALQWTLNYVPTDISAVTVTATGAATAASKSIVCNPTTGSLSCVLFGMNSTVMANGVIGTVAVTISPAASSTSSVIQITNNSASSSAGITIPSSAAGTTIGIIPSAKSFSISGTISPASSGTAVTLSGTASAATTTSATGAYSFTGLANGAYTVTPSRAGMAFTPSNKGVTINGASQTGVNFTSSTAQTFSISGTISPAAGGSGATVTLSGTSSGTTTANSSGAYSFAGLANGSYTVTPAHSGFAFTPSSTSLTINGANQTVNFTAASTATFTVSGTISPTAGGSGATVTLSGAASATTTANASGAYSFAGLANGSYTVTPTHSGYVFTPSSTTFSISGASQTINFTATSTATFTISGTISPTAGGSGATVTLSGTANATTTANASGAYSFSGLANGSYTVTPAHSGYVFTPSSTTLTISGSSQTVNFTATSTATFTISGTISPTAGGSGATVKLSGTSTATTIANASGAYSFAGLANGSYTVTPSQAGYTFTPSSTTLTISGASQVVNFTAASTATFTISGAISVTAGGSGATVTLTGKASAVTIASAAGAYTFTGLVNGTYTVTPSKAGRAFAPTSQTVTINGANIIAINFTAGTGTSNVSKNTSRGTAESTAALRHQRNALDPAADSGISLTGMTCTPASVTPPARSTCQVTLSAGAPAAGAELSLSGGANAIAPASLVIAPGATVSSFTADTTAVTAQTTALMTATLGGSSISSPLTLLAPPPSNALSVDVTTSQDSTSISSSVTSLAFSTASGDELLVAMVSASSATPTSVSRVEGGGLNWVRTVKTNSQGGTSEVWRAFAPSTLSNVSVTATLSSSAYSSLTVMSFQGADPGEDGSGAIGAVASANAAATLVTTRDGSWVLGVGNAGSVSTRVAGPGQHIVHQFQSPNGGTSWAQRELNATSAADTTVSLNAVSSDRYNLSAVEILPRSACMTGLAPQQRSFAMGGGSSAVAVANGFGCSWRAATDSPSWITLNNNSGTGNSSFTFTAAANMGKTRLGTVRVGNQSFKVLQEGSTQVFADVPESAPFFDYTNLMYASGISTGCGSSPLEYCPSQPLTRRQMAALVVSALDHLDRSTGALPQGYTTAPYFQDVPATDPSFPFVQRLADLGLTGGCSAARYCPSSTITHGEMAKVMVLGWMRSSNLTSFTSAPAPYFTDVATTDAFFPYVQKMRDMGFWTGCSATEYCTSSPVLQSDMSALVMRSLVGAP